MVITGGATTQPSQVDGTQYNINTLTAQTTHNSGSVAPNPSANNIVIAWFWHAGTSGWTFDAGFTGEIAFTANDVHLFYILNSANATEEFNATSDVNRDSGVILQMLEGAAAAATGGGRLTLLGVG